MQQATVSIQSAPLVASRPIVINSGDTLVVEFSLLAQAGAGNVKNILILAAAMDGSVNTRLTLPWFVGGLASGERKSLGLSFPAAGLKPGQTHTIAVRGTYAAAAGSQPFSMTISAMVPTPISFPIRTLAASPTVETDSDHSIWRYTLNNREQPGSKLSINNFQIRLNTPFTVVGTPAGWAVQTDNKTFVLWYVPDPAGRSDLCVAPAGQLSGFSLQSASKSSEGAAYSIGSRALKSDPAAAVGTGTVLAPGHLE